MQYSILSKNIAKDGGKYIVPEGLFEELLRAALYHAVEFDQQYYLEKYPDVAKALKARKISSAHDHYILTGYFESRLPHKIMVDERYYFAENPDVAQAVKDRMVNSAQDHFENTGFAEGRLPFESFRLIGR